PCRCTKAANAVSSRCPTKRANSCASENPSAANRTSDGCPLSDRGFSNCPLGIQGSAEGLVPSLYTPQVVMEKWKSVLIRTLTTKPALPVHMFYTCFYARSFASLPHRLVLTASHSYAKSA